MEGNNLLARAQHGFWKGLSCLTNLPIPRENWAAVKGRNIHVDVVFTNISKALDSIPHSGFKLKLQSFEIH